MTQSLLVLKRAFLDASPESLLCSFVSLNLLGRTPFPSWELLRWGGLIGWRTGFLYTA